MTQAFDPQRGRRGLFEALLDARDQHGGGKPIIEDIARTPLTYDALIRASLALGRKLSSHAGPGQRAALLLPGSVGAAAAFFALHAFAITPVMLNFTAGLRNLKAACEIAEVKVIITSHRFIEQAKLQDVIDAVGQVAPVVYLEDVRASLGPIDKVRALFAALNARRYAARTGPDDIGVILFTSGSFGAPRGVVLTNANLVSNVEQTGAHIPHHADWVLFSPLPVFHSLGLTGGLLLPLLLGMKAFLYPSPLHAKQIAPLIRKTHANILIATDTFLSQYVRAGQPGDLAGLAYVFCGAERVRPETHDLLPGVAILEGYGATEASPVIAVNTPQDNVQGTVGRVAPGIETRIEPVPGITKGGRLLVRGPNIMAGYLDAQGRLEAPEDGWHDTGDVASIDEHGRLTLHGRIKRFAKLGGEMVSLAAVEALAGELWPGSRHAAVAVSDGRKGEKIILVSEQADSAVADLAAFAQAQGLPSLMVPKTIVRLSVLPLLGTGKTDYVAVQRIVEAEGKAGS
ncbi:MAG: 2-acylglycerophosphoethanolamine acyltransferase [Caulobacteraceae bacterium]|nr:2-acylglycerophosphoethanolamine acyltransferase [Caulobacteraceae bacterium]